MDRKHIQTILTDLLFLGVAAYVFYETATRFAAAGAAKGGALTNAAFYPRLLAGLMLVLALCNIAKQAFLSYKEHRPGSGSTGPDDTSDSREKPELRNVMLGFGCLAWFWGYICILEFLGYLIATPIMLAGILAALGVRKPWANLAYAAGGTMGMYLFFQEMLDVVLPIGLLGRFME